MTVPFKVDLTDKVAVVTGGGGVLGSYFASFSRMRCKGSDYGP